MLVSFFTFSIGNSGVSRYNQYALVFHFGLLQVADRYELTTVCRMDLYRFPFDTQICSITFQSVLNTGNLYMWKLSLCHSLSLIHTCTS